MVCRAQIVGGLALLAFAGAGALSPGAASASPDTYLSGDGSDGALLVAAGAPITINVYASVTQEVVAGAAQRCCFQHFQHWISSQKNFQKKNLVQNPKEARA